MEEHLDKKPLNEEVPGQDAPTPEDQATHMSAAADPRKSDSGLRFRKKKKDEGQEQIAALQQELAESKDKFVRLYADYDNFRRRTAREKLEMLEATTANILREFLPVVDDFERAMDAIQKTDAISTLDGIRLIYNKLMKVMEQKGLRVMEAQGSKFDPDLHDALAQLPAPSDELKGMVIEVLEKGYLLNERIIRHAKVVVGV